MRVDLPRLRQYLLEITKNAEELQELTEQNQLGPDTLALKAAKYILVELAEAMANTLQHILAKNKGIAVAGYLDTLVKGHQYGIISDELFQKLRPFFDFRNSLIHRYWTIDDELLIRNIQLGHGDFLQFVDEVEAYLSTPG